MRNGDFIKEGVNQTQDPYVVEEIIPRNRQVLWASVPGEGKSMLGAALLYSVAYGAPFLDRDVTAGNVVFVDSENRKDILVDRATKIKRGLEMDGYTMRGEVDFQHYSGFLLDNKETWKPIMDEMEVLKPSLVMFDHLLCFHNQDENKATPMQRVADALEEMMSIYGSSILLLHHFNKNEGSFFKRCRGSSVIYAKCDAAYEVRTLSVHNGRLGKIGFIPQARKGICGEPMRIRIDEGNDWIKMVFDGTYQPVEDPVMDKITHDIFHIFLDEAGAKTVLDIKATVAGYASEAEIRRGLRLCEKRGLLSRQTSTHGKFVYELSERECPWCVCKS